MAQTQHKNHWNEILAVSHLQGTVTVNFRAIHEWFNVEYPGTKITVKKINN
jgi:hypothetical protein